MEGDKQVDKILAIDVGNSSVKVYLGDIDGKDCELLGRIEKLEHAALIAEEEGVKGVAFLATRHLTAEEQSLAKENDWWELTGRTEVPMEVWYDRSTLGPDRLAAALACSDEGEDGALIIDAGTALTIDVVSCAGEFMGGNISPGLRLRLDSLAGNTSRLPRLKDVIAKEPFGTNTKEAIASGVMSGMVGEMILAFINAWHIYEVRNIYLTGGNGEVFAESLARNLVQIEGDYEFGKIFIDETLVGKGLIEAYRYNHE